MVLTDRRLLPFDTHVLDDGTDLGGQGWSVMITRGAPQTLVWVRELDRSHPLLRTPWTLLLLLGPTPLASTLLNGNMGMSLASLVLPDTSMLISPQLVHQPSLLPVILSTCPRPQDREGSGKMLKSLGEPGRRACPLIAVPQPSFLFPPLPGSDRHELVKTAIAFVKSSVDPAIFGP